ncbi:MFS transporter [Roseateles sp.]|uniref:MFS transporter n=1 Tax=Roseateles sp. TaxID=1971397 RepID=UPI0031DE9DD7
MATRDEIGGGAWRCAIAVGAIALLMLGLQPLVLGELLESGRVTLEGVGVVAMAEIVGLGVGVLTGDLALPVGRLRLITALAALITAGLDLLTLRVSGDVGFALIRAAAGVGEGVLVWATTSVLVRSAQPERKAGIFFVIQTVAQGVVGLVLARLVVPAHGWQGAFVVLAVLSAMAMVLAVGLPGDLRPLSEHQTAERGARFVWSIASALPLLIAFLVMATLGSLWAYIEPLGKRAGYGAVEIQTLIAAGLGMQVIGGSIGSVLVRRLPLRATLATSAVVLGLAALGIGRTGAGDVVAFALLCGVFTFVWLFVAPFQMGLAFAADASGRVAALIPAAQLFGVAFGPLVASLMVEGEEAGAVPLVSAGFAAVTVGALLLAVCAGPHPNRSPASGRGARRAPLP